MTWESLPIPGGWQFTDNGSEARIIIDYIVPTSRGLDAWVEVHHPDHDLPLVEGTTNLMSARAKQPFVEETKGVKGTDWEAGFRLAFHTVISSHRDEGDAVDLVLLEHEEMDWLVSPFVAVGANTRVIAPGGAGKSLFAMAMALTVVTGSRKFLGLNPEQTGPVLYLDWEANAQTHANRLATLCETVDEDVPDSDQIMYRLHAAPLLRSALSVRRTVEEMGAVMLVVDSLRMAAGPSGQSSGEDTAIGLYSALRQIGVPALILDHKTKEDIARKRRGGYGSIFLENLARLQWEFTEYSEPAPNVRQWAMSLEKENDVGKLRPFGFKLETKGGERGMTEAQFTQIDTRSVYMQSPDQDLGDRIVALLQTMPEPLSVGEIAAKLGSSTSTVRGRLNGDSQFENLNAGTSRVGLWKLAGDTRTEVGEASPFDLLDEGDEEERVDEWEPEDYDTDDGLEII